LHFFSTLLRLSPGWLEKGINSQSAHSIALIDAAFFFCRFPPKNRMSSPQTT
jgi:hypothetical protein